MYDIQLWGSFFTVTAVPCGGAVSTGSVVVGEACLPTSVPSILFGTLSSLCIVPWPRRLLLYKRLVTRVDVEGRFLAAPAGTGCGTGGVMSRWVVFF